MKSLTELIRSMLVFIFLTLVLSFSAFGDDAILYPGYIKGNVTVGNLNIENTHISASGNNYHYASKTTQGSNYSLTVQGGDWNYSVSARAFIRQAGTSYPYTYMYFQNRTFPVPVGATVTNNYSVNPGTIKFQVTITGDSYSSWYAYGYAYKSTSPGQEQTNSQSYFQSTSNGSWEMPVVSNERVRLYAYVYVDNKTYYFYTDYEKLEDVAAGQTVVVPLNVVHSVPPPSQYGTVQGQIELKNLDQSFYYHYFSADPKYVYSNPGQYLLDRLMPGLRYIRPVTYLDNGLSSLSWPYTGGSPQNDLIDIVAGQQYTKNFNAETGTLSGKLSIRGTLKNEELNSLRLQAYGPSYSYYDPALGRYVYPVTYGGYATTRKFGSDGNYRMFLTAGPWLPYYISAQKSGYVDGIYGSQSFSITDYDYYNDNSSYKGKIAQIAAGENLVQDRSYCTGSLAVTFRIDGGGLISNPYISGSSYIYNSNGTVKTSASASASKNVKAENPEVVVHGIPGPYTFNCSGTTSDGSNVQFARIAIDLECGVRKGRDFYSPLLAITSPTPDSISNALFVPVKGTASDDTGVTGISVNGTSIPFSPTGNPDKPKEVAFSHDLAVQNGMNVIRTEAADAAGHVSFDERKVYIDRWIPTVAIVTPAEENLFTPSGSAVPVTIKAADQGYGYTLKVYLDSAEIASGSGSANDTVPEMVFYEGNIGPFTPGKHILRAEVIDAAGNSSSSSITINSYLAADITVKPEARHNKEEGTSTIFVQLPDGLTKQASLLVNDNLEVTASPVQYPYDVRYSVDEDKVIIKFKRTPELMADPYYTVEGKYFPNPDNPEEFYYWRGSDTTLW